MAENRAKTQRCSLPRIDTSSNNTTSWQAASTDKKDDESEKPSSSRPHTLQDQILNSVASSLSLSPKRLRESLAMDRDATPHSVGHTADSAPILEDLTIQTKVLSGSKTLADMETKLIPASAHSMTASLVNPDVDDTGSESDSGFHQQAEKEVVPEEDSSSSSSSDDDVDMRSASIMIAPEKIHRASRMETGRLRGIQDFDKHVRMPSADERPPMPLASFDKPGEVELFLGSEKAVSKVVVLRPRAGLFEDKMVACLTLSSIPPNEVELPKIELISPSHMFFAGTQIASIKQNLRDTKLVDEKAIPEVWIPLERMPYVPEKDEIDRRRLRTWVQNANQDIYERVHTIVTDQALAQPENDIEKEVQKLVARVLQVPQDQVGMNFAFGQLGGDEVTAMALVTNARVKSIFLESHEILHQGNTLAHLAAIGAQRGGLAHKWNTDQSLAIVDVPETPTATFFDLSPMQKLYFHTRMGGDAALRASSDGSYRFNSSLLFRVGKGFAMQDISATTDAVVGQHAMLRSRFAEVKGEWMQRILPKVEGSYSFMHYTISTNQQVEAVVQNTQAMINVEEGPVFAVAHLQTTDGHQMIFVAAHHLVVDVASWRLIISDMDESLQQGTLLSQKALPFQQWTELQKMDAQMPSGGLPFELSPGDLSYWDLADSSNTYADASEASFSLSEELTSILETTCNQVLRTESVDIYISALMLSFAQTFPDRGVPDVWNQEVGRDLWSSDIDISETVGWFTTLCPLNQQIYASSDFVDVLRRLKDTRRAIPHRGAHYFASKFFNNDRSTRADSPRPSSPHFLQIATRDWPIEILFSHAGEIQNLGRDSGVLEQMALPGRINSRISDIGPAVGRIALFEVNTTIDQGSAKIKFLYNRNSKHTNLIKTWITNYEHLLLEAIGRLRFAEPELTLADIPQLWATGVTYEGLTKLNRTIATELGLSGVNEVEAVYPVTPVQQTILVSQAKALQYPAGCTAIGDEDDGLKYVPNLSVSGNSSVCHIHTIHEFANPDGASVDLTRIVSAWDQVVARYAALRTVFIESVAETGLFNAVVLRRWNPNMLFLDATPSEDPVDTLTNLPPLTASPGLKSVPRHRLTVCHSPMKTVVKLDVSAALCDMMSVNTLVADLKRGYATGRLLPVANSDSSLFSYSGYLDIMRGLDRERSIEWWRAKLATVTQPCLFPRLNFYHGAENKDSSRRYDNVHVEMPDIAAHKVTEFCRVHKTTTGTILRLAWGMVLRSVTGMNDICFGYRAPGRSATLEGMRSAAGCFANTIAISFDLSAYKPVAVLLRQIEDGYNSALPHQHITMAEVQHALASGKTGAGVNQQLLNTCLAFTEEPVDLSSRFSTQKNCELRNVMNHETTDYDMTINTRFSSATGRLIVDISHSILSETQAHNIANTVGRAVNAILKCTTPSEHIGSLDLFSDRDYAQIINWTNPSDKDTQQQRRLLHELIFDQSITRPDSKAVCAHDGDLTYGQIEILSHRLAHILLEAGIIPKSGRKAAVPVILDKSKWAPIALLAVLRAGAAFVPVDADEMGFLPKIMEQLGPSSKIAIACTTAAADLESSSSSTVPLFDRVICLNDALMKRLEREIPSPGVLLPPSKSEDVSCVFFTPTSSRSVRGISFTHAALSTCFIAQGPAVGIKSTTRVLQLSSFNVDVALSEVFTTLVHGGAMCIPTSRDRYEDYTGCVTRFSANWTYMTPLLSRKLNVDLLPTLKTVCFRTRGLDEDTYEPWQGRKRVVMAYGAPDVCPLGISFLEIYGPHHLRAIGRPIAGSAWIVSGEDHRNLMPVGAVGEMVIEGPTLGKTFRTSSLASDEEKELPDTPTSPNANRTPFTKGHQQRPSISTIHSEGEGQGKKRYYKTGHSVRYIEGGLMEYVSSKRDDLEINGRIVNLAELEQFIRRALGRGSDVMVEALTFKGERGRQPTLAAFLELGSDIGATASREHSIELTKMADDVKQRVCLAKKLVEKALSGEVPDALIPKIYIPVRHLPTTYSLKVNRRKLQRVIKGLSREQLISLATVKNPEQDHEIRGVQPMPMSGPEAKVRTIWAEVLKIDEGTITPSDGFIKLGGDEISAAKVVVHCRKKKLPMTIADLMRDVPLSQWCRGRPPNGAVHAQPILTPGQPMHQGQTDTIPGQAIVPTEEAGEANNTLDRALDNAIESMQQQHLQEPSPPVQHTTNPNQMSTAATAVAASTSQGVDRAFIETFADKLLMEPSLIRDVAEATSTQVRHIETAILTQGAPRMTSTSPHGTGPANMSYFVFHFTAASSTSSVSARRIEEVCHILASIHPILRTAFVTHVEGQTRKLYQVVLKSHNVDFNHISRVQSWRLSSSIDKEIKKDRERVATEHDLFARPITKFIFLDAGKTSALVMRLSRAQYDDQTIALLVKDLKKLYDGGHNPPRRPGFADFVREAALAQVGDEAERYWRGLLDGALPTQVVRHTKPPKLSNSVRTLRESVSVNATTMGGLGMSFDTVLKAAWGMVLATMSGTPDVVFGEVVDGCHSRLQQHLGPSSVNRGGVLGPTSTILPVRIRFADSPTSPMKLLECVASQRASGVPYENLGMLDIVEKCTAWPYWTRFSTVVQHRADSELLMDGKAKPFRLGQALCKINLIDSEIVDIPDFLVRSIVKDKSDEVSGTGKVGEKKSADKAASEKPRASLMDGDEQLEISVTFCEQRVPASLAQEVLNKVCAYVGMLTGVSIMQNVIPTAMQYSSLAKQVPLVSTIFGSSPMAGVGGVTFNNPFGGGTIQVNFAQLEAKMSSEQRTTIQATIEDAWRSTLDPRTLGVPEEHVTTAAFYDLWGSLIPAAHLADYITDMIPLQLSGELATNLFGNNLDGFVITMNEIVDNPTMLDQFQLIVRKAFGGEGRDRSHSVRNRTNSLPHSIRKSNSLTNIANGGAGRKSSSQSSLALSRSGTIATLHGQSKLGHSRNRSDSTGGHTDGSLNDDSPAMNSAPVFPAHPAVSPPISTNRAPPSVQTMHSRKNSDASNVTYHSAMTAVTNTVPGSVVSAATSISNTPPTSIGSPNPSELPGSAHYHPGISLKRSASIRNAEASPESPILGNANMMTSPQLVQTGFVAARKKTNFSIGSSLRRMASNALRPGLQNHNNANGNASRSVRSAANNNSSNLSLSTLAPPKSSGSDMSNHSRNGSKDRESAPPVSPWVRVQSMAPQLPPFSPFSPVTEDAMQDAFSLTGSSDGQSLGSMEMSHRTTSRGTSPDLLMQCIDEGEGEVVINVEESSPTVMERISGTLVVDENGDFSRHETAELGPEGRMSELITEEEEPDDEEGEGEATLRANQAQALLAKAQQQPSERRDSPIPYLPPPPPPPPQQPIQRHIIVKQQQDAKPSPSPVTETFYMEDDEGSEAEDVDHSQYDSYEEADTDSAPATPRQKDQERPVTMIHSPQQSTPATFGGGSDPMPKPKQSPRYSVFPRTVSGSSSSTGGGGGADEGSSSPAINGMVKKTPTPPLPAPSSSSSSTTTTNADDGSNDTDVQDFASLEAAEMADMVSPLTPVEQAMLYKQRGMPRQMRSLNISPMTPPSYFPQQGAEMGGFHAI